LDTASQDQVASISNKNHIQRLRILDEFQKIRKNIKKENFGQKHGLEVLVTGLKKIDHEQEF